MSKIIYVLIAILIYMIINLFIVIKKNYKNFTFCWFYFVFTSFFIVGC